MSQPKNNAFQFLSADVDFNDIFGLLFGHPQNPNPVHPLPTLGGALSTPRPGLEYNPQGTESRAATAESAQGMYHAGASKASNDRVATAESQLNHISRTAEAKHAEKKNRLRTLFEALNCARLDLEGAIEDVEGAISTEPNTTTKELAMEHVESAFSHLNHLDIALRRAQRLTAR